MFDNCQLCTCLTTVLFFSTKIGFVYIHRYKFREPLKFPQVQNKRQNISLTFIIMCRLKNVSSAQINRLLSCSSHVGTCVPVMVRSAFCFYTLWFIHVCVIMFLFFGFFCFTLWHIVITIGGYSFLRGYFLLLF